MNSQQSNIKQISITGSAATAIGGSSVKRTRRRRNMMGGETEDNNENPALATNTNTIRLNITKKDTNIAAPLPLTNNANIPLVSANTTSVNQLQHAGSQPKPKIIIAPKQRSRKVILAPKNNIIKPKLKPVVASTNKLSATKRRVSVHIANVKNKIAKTRKHIRESQQLSIDKIRKELIASKLLNPASKAPDALLRKIYADMKIIAH